MPTPEAQAREKIDEQLIASGWNIQDYKALNLGAGKGIPTGTNIKPLECLLFLRDTRSRTYFEQMKGRGTRVLTPTDLQAVSGEDAGARAFALRWSQSVLPISRDFCPGLRAGNDLACV